MYKIFIEKNLNSRHYCNSIYNYYIFELMREEEKKIILERILLLFCITA